MPKENMLPKVKGLKGPFTCLNSARFGISWGALGAACKSLCFCLLYYYCSDQKLTECDILPDACFDVARQYTMDRNQFGAPLAA